MRKFIACLAIGTIGIAFISTSCSNGPGPGGKATITGKVFVKDINSLCVLTGIEYYKPDEEVYIIYGDDPSYGDRVRTGPDGTYMFQFLRPGTYTVYAYSDICPVNGSSIEAIKQEITIADKAETIVAPDIVVKK